MGKIITVNVGENVRTRACTAAPGDVVELAPGAHSGEMVFLSPAAGCVDGTPSRPITVRSQDPNNPAVISSAVLSPFHLGMNQFVVEDLSYWRIQNIRIADFDNAGLVVWAKNKNASNVVVDGLIIENQKNTMFGGGHHHDFGPHTVLVGGSITTLAGVMSDVVVKNCRISHADSGTPTAYNEVFTIAGNVDGVLIENNEIRDSEIGIAFNVLGAGANSAWGWLGRAQPRNVTFRGNKVINLIRSNYACAAFYCDRAQSNIVWEENFVSGVTTLLAISHEPGFADTIGGSGYTVRKNVGILGANGIYGTGGAAGMLIGSNTPTTPVLSNIEINNNVLVMRQPNAYGVMLKMQRATNVKIHHNVIFEESAPHGADMIFYATQDDFGVPYPTGTGPDDSTWSISCNGYASSVVDINVARGFTWPSTGTKIGLSAWKATGNDAGSTKIAPAFVNAAGASIHDFALTNDPGLSCGRLGIY